MKGQFRKNLKNHRNKNWIGKMSLLVLGNHPIRNRMYKLQTFLGQTKMNLKTLKILM